MRSEEELTHLFTEYFGEKLSPAQIDTLISDVRVAVQNRRARTVTDEVVTSSSLPA